MDFNVFFFVAVFSGLSASHEIPCDVRARTEYGWVCGLTRLSEAGSVYASFRGFPYAKQPVGELRFKELQPPEPWDHDYDAREEGPVCPQVDQVYGFLTDPHYGMSEACIHVNVHVPIFALPHDKSKESHGKEEISKDYVHRDYVEHEIDIRNPKDDEKDDVDKKDDHDMEVKRKGSSDDEMIKEDNDKAVKHKGLPVLVFIHGGGFYCGSGDADLNGPEYLVSKDVIVITFNYRIGVFGFLSLNSSSIPGNQGLRDQVTLLRWVSRNVRNFGGDPDDVTLMGQSAGAASAHILSLSPAAKGLFKRVAVLSGTAYQAIYTASPVYASTIAVQFLNLLGITSVDPEEIHHELTQIPLKRIIDAFQLLQQQYGIVNFTPVIESKFPGITTVLDTEPETLIAEGKGKEYPFLIGHTDAEAQAFRLKIGYDRYLARANANPRTILPPQITFSSPPNVSLALGKRLVHYCLGHEELLDDLVTCIGNTFFIYQAFRLARQRAEVSEAPTYLYQFAYHSDYSVVREGLNLNSDGAMHVEDLTFILKANSLEKPGRAFPPKTRDDMMKDWMSSFIVNFMKCDDPTCGKYDWPPVKKDQLFYQDIRYPYEYKVLTPTHAQQDMIQFYDKLYEDSTTMSANIHLQSPKEKMKIN